MAESSQRERLIGFLSEANEALSKNAKDLDSIGEVIKSIKLDPEKTAKLYSLYKKEFALAIENKRCQDNVKLYAELVIKLDPTNFLAHHSLKQIKSHNRLHVVE